MGIKSGVDGTQSIQRALSLLRLIAEHQGEGLRFVDILKRSGLERSTVHRLLACLVEERYAERDFSSKRYRLGVECVQLGLSATHKAPLVDACYPTLQRLTRMTGDTVFLIVRHGDFSFCVAREMYMSRAKTIVTDVGKSRLLGIGPAGVALLAAMPDREVEEILARRKEEYEQMGLKRRKIEKIIQVTRMNGFSETHNSITFGVSGVGCAFPISPTVFVALSIAAENERMPPARCKVLGEMLIQESRDLQKIFLGRQRVTAGH